MSSIKRLGLLTSSLLAACNQPGACKEVSRTLITEPSAPVLMGAQFAEVRATIGGTRSGPMQWHENQQYVRGFPPPGETEIEVTIVEPTMAWDIRTDVVKRSRSDRITCPHYLETELEIQLRSDDGVLDASITVSVDFDTPDSVTIWADVTGEDLGDLPWDPVEPDAEIFLVLEYGTVDGPQGSLRYSYEESDDSGNGVGFMTELATWTLPNTVPKRHRSKG